MDPSPLGKQTEKSMKAYVCPTGRAEETARACQDQTREDNSDVHDVGDFWLVKSERVKIQMRKRMALNAISAETYITSVAVGGYFMRGHKLIVEPRDGNITWSFGETHQPIFDDGKEDSDYEIADIINVRHHNRRSILPGAEPTVRGVTLELPDDVEVGEGRGGSVGIVGALALSHRPHRHIAHSPSQGRDSPLRDNPQEGSLSRIPSRVGSKSETGILGRDGAIDHDTLGKMGEIGPFRNVCRHRGWRALGADITT